MNSFVDRAIFCTYWLYFNGFRCVLGETRLLDYIGMSLVVVGLTRLILNRHINFRLMAWVIVLLCPLIFVIMFDPNTYTTVFFIKTYVVALYFVSYFKTMRITIAEFVCFAAPVVISIYFFINPRPSDAMYVPDGRLAGISEPNFTSLSLIISMCGAFGIYGWTRVRRMKLIAVSTVLACFCGVLLTASRAGLVAMTIALYLFLTVEKRVRYAGVIVVVMVLSMTGVYLKEFVIFERFQNFFSGNDLATTAVTERYFTGLAWLTVQNGNWFIAGAPTQVSEWGRGYGVSVPHNSLLDLGVAFGKASFYFYSAFVVVLLIFNIRYLIATCRHINNRERDTILASILFLALFPMYMSLSAGMAMDFIMWLVLGAYPLFGSSRQLVLSQRKMKRDIMATCSGI